jgi:voltage-gated potassium channel
MSRSIRRLAQGVAVFVGICIVGAVGYSLAGWTVMDAVYMVIITIFSVGYTEIQPVSTPGLRVFTMALIVGGYGAAIYAVGGFVQLITEGEINRALGARRTIRGIDRMQGHTVICGFGRMGRILARELEEARVQFVLVERDPAKIVEAEALGYLVVAGDASREDVLQQAGVERAAWLATVLPSDAANVFVTLTATGLNRGLEVIARAEDPASEPKLRRSGATTVVMPAAIGAERVAHMVAHAGAAEFLRRGQIRDDFREELGHLGLQLEEMRLSHASPLIGRPIAEIEVRGNRGFLIVGVRRGDGSVLVNPPAETPLAEGETVIVVGHPEDLPQLRRRYELERQLVYRGARL